MRGDVGGGELGLVDLSFRDFNVEYEKCHRYETNIQVSLRSLLMEDLSRPPDSKHRCMVQSSMDANELPHGQCYLSRSCPDLINPGNNYGLVLSPSRGSLPDHLETENILGAGPSKQHKQHHLQLHQVMYPKTPPPSPKCTNKQRPHDNLVLISTLMVDPSAPNFKTQYNSVSTVVYLD